MHSSTPLIAVRFADASERDFIPNVIFTSILYDQTGRLPEFSHSISWCLILSDLHACWGMCTWINPISAYLAESIGARGPGVGLECRRTCQTGALSVPKQGD